MVKNRFISIGSHSHTARAWTALQLLQKPPFRKEVAEVYVIRVDTLSFLPKHLAPNGARPKTVTSGSLTAPRKRRTRRDGGSSNGKREERPGQKVEEGYREAR